MQAQDCLDACREAGAVVKHGVDATKIHEVFATQAFSRIVFNFPHTGSQRVHLNRALLLDFFQSATYAPFS
jgi:hypothetical protein